MDKDEKTIAVDLAKKLGVKTSELVRASLRFMVRNQAVAKAELRDD